MRAWLLRLSLMLLGAPPAVADTLTGDTEAAVNSAEGAQFNPANAGFMNESEFFYAPEIYKKETVSVRYPGYEASVQDTSGVATPLTKPAILYKLNPRLGIGGFFIPALPVKIAVNKPKVPVVLLGSQYKVDIAASGKLNGLGVGMIGYKLSDMAGVGLGVAYQAFAFDAALTPSDGGPQLASVNGSQSMLDVIVGARVDPIPGRLSFGVAVNALSHQTNIIAVNSPLISSSDGSGASNGGTNYQQSRVFTGALAGFALTLLARMQLLLDLRYTKVDPNQTAYSLADLKQKRVDIHDTVSVRLGTKVRLVPGLVALGGAHYEPASIGAGGRGGDSLAGYGTMQLIQVLAGLAPQVPYYMFAGGLQIGLFPKYLGRGRTGFFLVNLEGGLAYTYSSLGISAKGELPGAYLDRRLSLPVALSLKF